MIDHDKEISDPADHNFSQSRLKKEGVAKKMEDKVKEERGERLTPIICVRVRERM